MPYLTSSQFLLTFATRYWGEWLGSNGLTNLQYRGPEAFPKCYLEYAHPATFLTRVLVTVKASHTKIMLVYSVTSPLDLYKESKRAFVT